MAINKEKLASIISGRARELCSVQGDKKISGFQGSRNNYDPDPNSFGDADYYDKMYLSEASYSNVNELNYNDENLEVSRLPEHIKKSFSEQKISMANTGGLSVLDEIGVKHQKSTNRIVNEVKTQSNPQISPQNIDYTIIKAIVNECLKEYFGKQKLNESTSLQTIGLKNGNISLVDDKGNIYRAKLEKIGNKNDKK